MQPQVRRSIVWWRLAVILVGFGRSSDAGFAIVDLGPLTANQSGGATAINQSGAISGNISGGGAPSQAAYASVGGNLHAINTTQLPGANGSIATAINAGNSIAGTFYDANDGLFHAFKATGGSAVDYGTITSGPLKGNSTVGVGISGSGEVLGTGHLSSTTSVVFRESSPGQATILTMPTGSVSSQAAGVNESGTAVGSYTNAQGASRVFIAQQNAATDLLSQFTTQGFGLNTYASAINNLSAVTGYGDFSGQERSFLTSVNSATGAKSLIDLGVASGFTSTVSTALNDLGQVVGKMDNQGANSRAFLWDSSTGVVDLNTLLAPTAQSHWDLTTATGINDSGMIVGQGYLNGQLHGFVLTPDSGSFSFFPSAVPTPPSVWLSLAGLAMTGGWFQIKRGRIAARDAA